MSEIGITTNSSGELQLDSADIDEVLASNFSDVAEFFSNDSEGIAFRLDVLASEFLASDGLIDSRQDGINSSIDRIGDRTLDLEYRMTIIQERLLKQYSALDALLVQMQSTSGFLSQQLASLPGSTR